MGTLHHLPSDKKAQARLLQKLVSDVIEQHPDATVAKRWMSMAQESMARYPGPPLPTQHTIDLDAIDALSTQQIQAIQKQCELWLQSYFNDVRTQLMSMHSDMLKLQKQVAESAES